MYSVFNQKIDIQRKLLKGKSPQENIQRRIDTRQHSRLSSFSKERRRRDVQSNTQKTEQRNVLANALLPGILYGWGGELCVHAPQNTAKVNL